MVKTKTNVTFLFYVIMVMWYIFMSESISLRPFTGVAWFAFAFLAMIFETLPSRKNTKTQTRNCIALGIIFFVSCLYSSDVFESFKYFLSIAMFFIIAYFITNTSSRLETVLRVCLAYCFFLGAVTYTQMFWPNVYASFFLPWLSYPEIAVAYLEVGALCGFTNQTGINAFWMTMGMGLSYFFIEKSKPLKYLATLFFFIALLGTGRRGPAIISVFVLILLGFIRGEQGWFRRMLFLGISALLLGILSEFIPYINNISDKFEILAESGNILNGRDVIYMQTLKGIGESPIFGHGLYSMYYYTPEGVTEQFLSHNAYLQYLFEVGIIGIFFVIKALLFPVRNGIRALKTSLGKNSSLRFCLFMQLFLLIWGLVESSFYDQYRFFILLITQFGTLTLMDYNEDFERIEKCPEQIKQ